jgi:hypothetical protein
VSDRETEHLRVLIANERKDRLALVAPIVVALSDGGTLDEHSGQAPRRLVAHRSAGRLLLLTHRQVALGERVALPRRTSHDRLDQRWTGDRFAGEVPSVTERSPGALSTRAEGRAS